MLRAAAAVVSSASDKRSIVFTGAQLLRNESDSTRGSSEGLSPGRLSSQVGSQPLAPKTKIPTSANLDRDQQCVDFKGDRGLFSVQDLIGAGGDNQFAHLDLLKLVQADHGAPRGAARFVVNADHGHFDASIGQAFVGF